MMVLSESPEKSKSTESKPWINDLLAESVRLQKRINALRAEADDAEAKALEGFEAAVAPYKKEFEERIAPHKKQLDGLLGAVKLILGEIIDAETKKRDLADRIFEMFPPCEPDRSRTVRTIRYGEDDIHFDVSVTHVLTQKTLTEAVGKAEASNILHREPIRVVERIMTIVPPGVKKTLARKRDLDNLKGRLPKRAKVGEDEKAGEGEDSTDV